MNHIFHERDSGADTVTKHSLGRRNGECRKYDDEKDRPKLVLPYPKSKTYCRNDYCITLCGLRDKVTLPKAAHM